MTGKARFSGQASCRRNRHVRVRAGAAWLLAALLGAAAPQGAAAAGTFYVNESDQGSWWYAMEDPHFWLLVPTNAAAYVQTDLYGERGLNLYLSEGGPVIEIRVVQGTNADAVWEAVRGRYGYLLRNARVIADQQITTDENLQARFRAIQGTTPGGGTGILRFVAFTRSNYVAYLVFLGAAGQYSGSHQRNWLRAVNSFHWR